MPAVSVGNHKDHPLYGTWSSIKTRCFNKRCKKFKNYGGRGITMCDEWKLSFVAFCRDMGDKPPGTSIDRINNDGDYCKSNCRWATLVQQANNSRRNVKLKCGGEVLTITQWRARLGFRIDRRVKSGWSIASALSKPRQKWNRRNRHLTVDGTTKRIADWAIENGLSYAAIQLRLANGWSAKEAVSIPLRKTKPRRRSTAM